MPYLLPQMGINEGMQKRTDHCRAANEQHPVQSVTHAAPPVLVTGVVAVILTKLNLIIIILETHL